MAASERVKDLAKRMWAIEDNYGPLHAIISHGNVDDRALAQCESKPSDRPLTQQERELIAYMRTFTPEERRQAYLIQGGEE